MNQKSRVDWADVSDDEISLSRDKEVRKSVVPNRVPEGKLASSIKELPNGVVSLCLLGIGQSASLSDIKKYFENLGVTISKFVPQKNKRVYVIQVPKDDALKAARVAVHSLMGREFLVKIDKEKRPLYTTRPKPAKRQYQQKADDTCLKSKTESTVQQSVRIQEIQSELSRLIRETVVSEQNLEIISIIKGKYRKQSESKST